MQLRFKDIVRALLGEELDAVDLDHIRQGIWEDPSIDEDDKDRKLHEAIERKGKRFRSCARERFHRSTWTGS